MDSKMRSDYGGVTDATARYGGGPVFLPRRKVSALAQAILSQPLELDRVTAYDELWYAGRPTG